MGDGLVDSVVAEALKAVGVPETNIQPDAPKAPEPVVEQTELTPTHGQPLGPVKGELPKGQATEEATPAEGAPEPIPEDDKPAEPVALTPEVVTSIITQVVGDIQGKFQSIADRQIAEARKGFEQTSAQLLKFMEGAEEKEIASLPFEEQITRRLGKLEQKPGNGAQPVAQPQPVGPSVTPQMLIQYVESVGLKQDDPRIDWAAEAPDFQTGLSRLMTSIAKAVGEDKTTMAKEVAGKAVEVATGKLRKQLGVDKVSTAGSSGQGNLPSNWDQMTPVQKLEFAYQQNALDAQAGKQ